MDKFFHLEQGYKLLENKNPNKALEHFIAANKMTDDIHIGQNKILYPMALCNLFIGNIEQAYRIALKAKKIIPNLLKSSMFISEDMNKLVCEEQINELINHLEKEYSNIISKMNTDNTHFNENELISNKTFESNFSNNKNRVIPSFNLDDLSDNIIRATFIAQTRGHSDLAFFDKLNLDVLIYSQGYLVSLQRNPSDILKEITRRCLNEEPKDFVDEERCTLIDTINLNDFLVEYAAHSAGKEPFYSFLKYVCKNILERLNIEDEDITFEDISFSPMIQDVFWKMFEEQYEPRIDELRHKYTLIFDSTCKSIAKTWIENIILNNDSK